MENINPLNILRVVEHGTMDPQTAGRIIKEVEGFAIEELKKLIMIFKIPYLYGY